MREREREGTGGGGGGEREEGNERDTLYRATGCIARGETAVCGKKGATNRKKGDREKSTRKTERRSARAHTRGYREFIWRIVPNVTAV